MNASHPVPLKHSGQHALFICLQRCFDKRQQTESAFSNTSNDRPPWRIASTSRQLILYMSTTWTVVFAWATNEIFNSCQCSEHHTLSLCEEDVSALLQGGYSRINRWQSNIEQLLLEGYLIYFQASKYPVTCCKLWVIVLHLMMFICAQPNLLIVKTKYRHSIT